jgi:hypothetical protein
MTQIYSGKYIYATEQGSGSNPYVTPDNKEKNWAGDIRYNKNSTSGLDVYDGSCWIPIQQKSYSLSLSPEVQKTVNWAQKKMAEEAKLEELMTRHPGVRAAWEQLEIMKQLCQETESQ